MISHKKAQKAQKRIPETIELKSFSFVLFVPFCG
jgi:hypothetical protein